MYFWITFAVLDAATLVAASEAELDEDAVVEHLLECAAADVPKTGAAADGDGAEAFAPNVKPPAAGAGAGDEVPKRGAADGVAAAAPNTGAVADGGGTENFAQLSVNGTT